MPELSYEGAMAEEIEGEGVKNLLKKEMVGTARFELATSRTPSVRATRLRYVPTAAAAQKGRKLTNSTVSLAFEQRQETA